MTLGLAVTGIAACLAVAVQWPPGLLLVVVGLLIALLVYAAPPPPSSKVAIWCAAFVVAIFFFVTLLPALQSAPPPRQPDAAGFAKSDGAGLRNPKNCRRSGNFVDTTHQRGAGQKPGHAWFLEAFAMGPSTKCRGWPRKVVFRRQCRCCDSRAARVECGCSQAILSCSRGDAHNPSAQTLKHYLRQRNSLE